MDSDRSLAIFIDFENLALGFSGPRDRFDIERVLERLVEKGKVVCKKAYADWSRFANYTGLLHEAAIELIEIPRRGQTGKNSADIRLCVDAMDLAYSKEHINTFVIVSGDSDFSPLVSKLKELGKHVIGLGMQPSTSDLLRDNCDEFIYYEDLAPKEHLALFLNTPLPEAKRKLFTLLLESLLALRRENKEVLWSSMIKDTMKRKKPSFNESYYGYRTFSELLEDAQGAGVVELETDPRSRTYKVARFGTEIQHPRPTPESGELPRRKRRRRRLNGAPNSAVIGATENHAQTNGHAGHAAFGGNSVPGSAPESPATSSGSSEGNALPSGLKADHASLLTGASNHGLNSIPASAAIQVGPMQPPVAAAASGHAAPTNPTIQPASSKTSHAAPTDKHSAASAAQTPTPAPRKSPPEPQSPPNPVDNDLHDFTFPPRK